MKEILKRLLKKSPIALSKNHRYDKQTKRIIQYLPRNSNCIDVGCHKGEILDLLRTRAPLGFHFGIEPLPILHDYLLNKYQQAQNCNILKFAASNSTDRVEFNYVITNPAYSGIKKRDYDKPCERDVKIKVQTRKIDDCIPANKRIDFIKIDVEGAELSVLEGCRNIIERDRPIIIFEHGMGAANHYGTTPEMIFAFFESVNLRISNLGSYIQRKESLTLNEFVHQYEHQQDYYFIAHR